MNRPRYIGPTYYGHPYLDGRGFFPDGHPLDKRDANTRAQPPIEQPYVNPYAGTKKAP